MDNYDSVIRYVHGSEDSTDVDVMYVFDTLPSTTECKAFCDGKEENGNIIVVRDGVVIASYKGSVDEVNNGLFYTYKLHKQDFPLIVKRAVKRDIILKDIKALRKILSEFTRTQYRKEVKEALRGGWKDKIFMLKRLDYKAIDFSNNTKTNKINLFKSFAFQLGQAIALHEGVELYTKNDIINYFPPLADYIQRKEASIDNIVSFIYRFASILEKIPVKEQGKDIVCFLEPYNCCYDINKEKRILERE